MRRRLVWTGRRRPWFLTGVIWLALGSAAAAQDGTAPPRVVAGRDGVALESADGDFRLQFGLLLHADGRFALADEDERFTDTFLVRRARPYLRGRLGRHFEFYLNPDLAGSTLVVQDAYLDIVLSRALRVRVGKAKVPFGMERLHSPSNFLFLEPAFPTALVPNRDVGVQALGELGGGLISYLGGVMNGARDGGSTETDVSDAKDLSGRLVVRPFVRRSVPSSVRGFALGLSGSTGMQSGASALPSFRTATLQQTHFAFAGTIADGRRTRYSPQVVYFNGPFGGWAEYVRTSTVVTHGVDVVGREIDHEAWQVAISWVLTGEDATDAPRGVSPRSNFGNGGWGAFQVAARYHAIALDPDTIALGLASAGSSRKAEAWTTGLNWYMSGNVRHTVNFERTVFDDDADGSRPAENALVVRTQVSF